MSAPPPYNPAVQPPEAGYQQPPAQPAYQQPPPQPAYQGYPPPSGGMQQQSNTNVVVVQAPTAQPAQTHVVNTRSQPNHLLHCIICFFCPWYLLIWIIICCVHGC